MKSKFTSVLFSLFFILTFVISCKREDSKECGCDVGSSNPTGEITGTISFKKQSDPNDKFLNDKFWISVDGLPSNWAKHYIVCNENTLPQEVIDLKNTGKTLKVKFSGNAGEICESYFTIPEYSYNRITLNSIKIE